MEKNSLHQIEEFLQSKKIVMDGVSRNKNKMGNHIFKELIKIGFNIFPMHKEMTGFENKTCYSNLSALPEQVTATIICTKPDKTAIILEELKKIRNNTGLAATRCCK